METGRARADDARMNSTTAAAPTTTTSAEHDPSGRGCALAGRVARNPRIGQTGDECEACMIALGWTSDPDPEPVQIIGREVTTLYGQVATVVASNEVECTVKLADGTYTNFHSAKVWTTDTHETVRDLHDRNDQ
jgi:hypothetical protein